MSSLTNSGSSVASELRLAGVARAQIVGTHVAGPCLDAVREPGLGDVLFRDRDDVRQIEDVGLQIRVGPGERHAVHGGAAADIEESAYAAPVHCLRQQLSHTTRIALHGVDEIARPTEVDIAGASRRSER